MFDMSKHDAARVAERRRRENGRPIGVWPRRAWSEDDGVRVLVVLTDGTCTAAPTQTVHVMRASYSLDFDALAEDIEDYAGHYQPATALREVARVIEEDTGRLNARLERLWLEGKAA